MVGGYGSRPDEGSRPPAPVICDDLEECGGADGFGVRSETTLWRIAQAFGVATIIGIIVLLGVAVSGLPVHWVRFAP